MSPCRKENYILLEQSVTVESTEVDSLVSKIGEVLQLHNNSGGHQKTVSVSVSCLRGGAAAGRPARVAVEGSGASAQKRPGCYMRLWNRGSSRPSPYSVPGTSEHNWDQIKAWNKKRVEEEEPHRLLQELILSGNLVKEAVRRLQFPGTSCGEFSRPDQRA
ncbi:glycogen synthase kinase binding protein [Synchiropus splendidus]|uniref:glycogen synthase kinase binding protein n=1 Tax=Synchiropus splendidus TaxID=270530 RepID=UPI00237D9A20|nr:glycogen synthase kinase binding protein [Synchiropus splendidus]